MGGSGVVWTFGMMQPFPWIHARLQTIGLLHVCCSPPVRLLSICLLHVCCSPPIIRLWWRRQLLLLSICCVHRHAAFLQEHHHRHSQPTLTPLANRTWECEHLTQLVVWCQIQPTECLNHDPPSLGPNSRRAVWWLTRDDDDMIRPLPSNQTSFRFAIKSPPFDRNELRKCCGGKR